MSQTSASSPRPTVHELQQLAREAGRKRRRRHQALSRAARLNLIDAMSRWASAGLALIAGAAIFIAVRAGGPYPLRAAIWGVLVLGALYLARRLTKDFRTGERSAARPFRWRANYSSTLAVVGTAFGAGAFIALPAGAPAELGYETLALMLAAVFGAAFLHAAHGRAALALAAPATVFILLAVLRLSGAGASLGAFAIAAAAGGGALYFFRRYLRQRAARRFPRTGFIRREVEPAGLSRLDSTGDAPASASA